MEENPEIPDDVHCAHCGTRLSDNPEPGTPGWDGFCSEACRVKWISAIPHSKEPPPDLYGMIERLQRKLDLAVEAPEFYADPETYWAWGFFPDPPCGPWDTDIEDIIHDGMETTKPGKRARAVLKQLEDSHE